MADDPNNGTTPASDPPPTDQKHAKYTDDDLNNIVIKTKAEQTAALLKELGVESTGKLKEDLKTLKEIQDKGKTEAERLAASAKEATDKLTTAEAEALAAKTENAALRAGVHPDKVERFVKLAAGYEGTPAERVAAMLKDFPEFKGSITGGQDFGSKSKDQGGNATDAMRARVEASMGLKKKA